MKARRDRQRSQENILKAARDEFALRGYWGARVDAIAEQAGVNKRMLYHYFDSKRGLFDAVMEQDPGNEPSVSMLLGLWAALLKGEIELPQRPSQAAMQSQFEDLKQAQQEARLPVQLHPGFLQLTLMGLEWLPLLMPEVVAEMTGCAPTEAGFQRRRDRFRKTLLDLLTAQAQANPRDSSGKPRIRLGH